LSSGCAPKKKIIFSCPDDGLDAKNTVCCGKMPNDHGNIADHCQAKKYLKKICFLWTYISYFFQDMKPEPHIFCNVQNRSEKCQPIGNFKI
jgi:hypothetical protein